MERLFYFNMGILSTYKKYLQEKKKDVNNMFLYIVRAVEMK